MPTRLERHIGFTLAEVLITIGIIGIVAAMTIPTLVGNYQKAQYYSAFMKAYAIVVSATTDIRNDNAGSLAGVFTTTDSAMNTFASKLQTVKTCAIADDSQDCFNVYSTIKTVGGGTPAAMFTNSNNTSMILKNGMMLDFKTAAFSSSCSGAFFAVNGSNMGCFIVHIDVNGKTGPSILGRDIFQLYFHQNGVVPDGVVGSDDNASINTLCNPLNSASTWNGATCGAKLLLDGQMNY